MGQSSQQQSDNRAGIIPVLTHQIRSPKRIKVITPASKRRIVMNCPDPGLYDHSSTSWHGRTGAAAMSSEIRRNDQLIGFAKRFREKRFSALQQHGRFGVANLREITIAAERLGMRDSAERHESANQKTNAIVFIGISFDCRSVAVRATKPYIAHKLSTR